MLLRKKILFKGKYLTKNTTNCRREKSTHIHSALFCLELKRKPSQPYMQCIVFWYGVFKSLNCIRRDSFVTKCTALNNNRNTPWLIFHIYIKKKSTFTTLVL